MTELLQAARAMAAAKLAGLACVPLPLPVGVTYSTAQLWAGGGGAIVTVTATGGLRHPAESLATIL